MASPDPDPDPDLRELPPTDALAADCERLLVVRDRRTGAAAVLAIHDTTLGPAHGGIRRWRYSSMAAAAADAVLLAEAMTWKCALAGVAAGGGKVVLVDRAGLDREAAYRLVGRLVAELGGTFFTGPDVGTTDTDLAAVARETRFVATAADDGPGDLAAATAEGVFAAIAALAERLDLPVEGLRVAVQGLGAVGGRLAALLAGHGARLVVADADQARAERVAPSLGAALVPAAAITTVPCDVFAPCALGGVLTEAVAAVLPARGICGAANNVFAGPGVGRVLHARGVLAVPDFVANAGALIQGAAWNLERVRVPVDRVRAIGATVREVLDAAAAAKAPPSDVALAMARQRVERARLRR
jgi:leucine dehydrogenase